ncbi:bifunctional phosphoribosylaminoimidazolecarboxamide formyltransferase/IMP cyclohydrolase [Saprospiraceae bacterium]|jgi:phosphoribosylaminoimidazolecarboxamide formyltransferase/IMP cyclohydrolase|nr:bifunctional phosphoribosylaminoimidazolecarboxamide formyltransferase/IMP cyclohydrolase [Saprospiraceae bacterium]MDA9358313.1 bifunctional phosphoribosylaminoimidazolecarboxamide formyltransferase/IMP cyclohydrolase [Saprospiraceae bacterium]MDB4162647.1 bifunctional phosphoribosylaminoimidazolecarboxamide formyltransferase/IMP cyclohydrolase [Saprospiraceae bacterium]MDB4824779.1 bifunctional phosphoribosylaminoimidazolecarboxamide formyltransferase/IMP cyclohydrolase [Saprospiraceae bact
MAARKIKSALISVFHKDGLDEIINLLDQYDVTIYSTGGTQKFIESHGVKVERVEDLTSYPSILDGRVKTLHPKVFGGILARRDEDHLGQLAKYDMPEIDLVIVDLYPFEDTVKSTDDEEAIIEKIDIGGIALIRGAAKNFNDVVIVPSKNEYPMIQKILAEQNAESTLADRKELARRAFKVSSHYDTAIFNYFDRDSDDVSFKHSLIDSQVLRYGENPHQQGIFFGELDTMFEKISGKELSFNNLVDVDAAVNVMSEFVDSDPTFAVLKHTNTCGIATRSTVVEAWHAALAGDPVSAFGGILISNTTLDLATAEEINKLFYEVVIAPEFDQDAINLLTKKKKRVLMKINRWHVNDKSFKSILNGVIQQDTDKSMESSDKMECVTDAQATPQQLSDLEFANKCVKHLKSNTIVLVKNNQLLGMGCGQTSRVDALRQAISKATAFGFDLEGCVMASDAFFPFPDCVEIAHDAGTAAVVQPGGSIKDNLSVDYCNSKGMPMLMTGIRHFKH